jgi:lipid A ethanolaminephosphotransferase
MKVSVQYTKGFMLLALRSLFSNKYQLNAITVIVFSVIYMVVFDNYAFWSSLVPVVDLSDPGMWLFLLACFGFIFAVCFTFLSVFGVGRLLKPLIAFLFILAACTSYYMDAYGTVFDDVMVLNIIETNVHEAFELFDLQILLHVLVFGIVPVFFLYRINIIQTSLLKAARIRLISVAIILSLSSSVIYASYKDFTFVFRENREISFFVNPVYPIRAIYRFTAKSIKDRNREFLTVFSDAHKSSHTGHLNNGKHNLLVLVVGETARAQDFHLNGDARNTTPNLDKKNIINFNNVSSCGTATAISLPCMFSDLVRKNFDNNAARDRQNLLDAINTAGLQVLWIENNPDCKGVCDRVETHQMASFYTDELCSDGQCFDEALLSDLDHVVGNLEKDAVIVLHTQGSHGPAYFRRYPEKFKQFMPECRQTAVQDCTDEEIVNAYDNTILYTDYFLSKVIDHLAANTDSVNPAMLYVSDHGESLGEDGVYLHGLPYFMAPEYQTKVPMILWMPESFSKVNAIDESCLMSKSADDLSHDYYLHSVLGLMGVSTHLYRPELDIFSSCRTMSTT